MHIEFYTKKPVKMNNNIQQSNNDDIITINFSFNYFAPTLGLIIGGIIHNIFYQTQELTCIDFLLICTPFILHTIFNNTTQTF